MALPPLLGSIVDWLRAGYPEGVPERDYLPLFALLRRQLGDDEVHQVAEELAGSSDPTTAGAIRRAISQVTNEPALDSDVSRVSSRLAAGGWPLAAPQEANRSH